MTCYEARDESCRDCHGTGSVPSRETVRQGYDRQDPRADDEPCGCIYTIHATPCTCRVTTTWGQP